MILGEGLTQASGPTLDELFRRAGVGDPQARALADPPNRAQFTDGPPRRFSFAEADRAITMLAARLRGLGLQADAVVGIQLANTAENVIALLGVMRAGMIAAPLPVLWRRQDIVAALGRIDAKAIITTGRIGTEAPATLATEVAAELFPIRYVCAFGQDLPDGVVALDDCLSPEVAESRGYAGRAGAADAHVAVVTFEATSRGLVPVARSHAQLIAGGRALPEVTGDVLSTIPPASFAGIVLTLLPWLGARSTMHLHHGFDPECFATQCDGLPRATLVLPGPALAPLGAANMLAGADTIIAVWRSPERLANAPYWRGKAEVIDVASFGELGVLSTGRPPDGEPVLRNPNPAIIEAARTDAGTLALRGPMVAAHAFPPGAGHDYGPCLAPDAAGFVDTGFACHREGDTWTITAPPSGLTSIGGYRLLARDVESQIADIDAGATVLALPHTATGQRLAGRSDDPMRLASELRARGVNPLIYGAFRNRAADRAA